MAVERPLGDAARSALEEWLREHERVTALLQAEVARRKARNDERNDSPGGS